MSGERFKMAPPVPCPCYGCDRRTPACHAECPGYAEYRRAMDEANEAARQEREKDRLGRRPGGRRRK